MNVPRASRLAVLFTLTLALAIAAVACGGDSGYSVKPNKGPYIGGDPVVISGKGFKPSQGFKIYFGDKKALNATVEGDSMIRVDPPGGTVNQTVDVLIVFDEGKQIRIPKAYTYIDPIGTPAASPPPGK